MKIRSKSLRQYVAYLESLGFTDIRPESDNWNHVLSEVNTILKQNNIPALGGDRNTGEVNIAWDSREFSRVAFDLSESLELFADERVYVFDELWTDNLNLVTAYISGSRLTEILEDRTFRNDLFIYLPGEAVLIHAWESRTIDVKGYICAKLFRRGCSVVKS